MEYPMVASCQCGQVSYELKKEPKLVMACHCRECQKLSSGPFSVTAVIDADAIAFRGELSDWSRPAESGNTNAAKFCPGCGNRIYHYNPDNPSTIKLKLKPTGIDDAIFEPNIHVWVSEKLSWFQLPMGVKTYEKQP